MNITEEWELFILYLLAILFLLIFVGCYTMKSLPSHSLKDRENKLHKYRDDITAYHSGHRDLARYCQVHYEWEYISIINTLKDVDWMSAKHIKKEFIVRNKRSPK